MLTKDFNFVIIIEHSIKAMQTCNNTNTFNCRIILSNSSVEHSADRQVTR